MTGRMQLLGRFRERWTAGALPLVVEHRAERPEHVCAAPSLWMGGRELAGHLKELGVGPGQVLALDLPLGIRWVQGLVAALRVGAAVTTAHGPELPLAARLGSRGLVPIAPGRRATSECVAWIDAAGVELSRGDLDELVPALSGEWGLAEGLRVLGELEGGHRQDLAASLAVLFAEGELHVVHGEKAGWPATLGASTPDLFIGTAPLSPPREAHHRHP